MLLNSQLMFIFIGFARWFIANLHRLWIPKLIIARTVIEMSGFNRLLPVHGDITALITASTGSVSSSFLISRLLVVIVITRLIVSVIIIAATFQVISRHWSIIIRGSIDNSRVILLVLVVIEVLKHRTLRVLHVIVTQIRSWSITHAFHGTAHVLTLHLFPKFHWFYILTL